MQLVATYVLLLRRQDYRNQVGDIAPIPILPLSSSKNSKTFFKKLLYFWITKNATQEIRVKNSHLCHELQPNRILVRKKARKLGFNGLTKKICRIREGENQTAPVVRLRS